MLKEIWPAERFYQNERGSITMKRIRIITAFLLMTMLLVSGCGKKGAADKPDGSPTGGNDPVSVTPNPGPDAAEVLTHVYIPQTYSMPEGFELNSGVTPYYEAETDTLVCVGQRISEDGAEYRLVTTQGASGVVSEEVFPLPEDITSVGLGFVAEDAVWLIISRWVQETDEAFTWIVRYSRESGKAEISPELNSLLGTHEELSASGFVRDADGDFFIYSDGLGGRCIYVFAPDFNLKCRIRPTNSLNGLFPRPDGSVWTFGQIDGGRGAARVDKETQALADTVRLSASASSSNRMLVRWAEDGTLLYETSEGVFASNRADSGESDGDEVDDFLMDFVNSGLISSSSVFLCAVNRDMLLYADENGKPVMWRSAEDIDLSTVRVLDLAFTANLSDALTEKIISFNREHPGVRIVVKDYVNLFNANVGMWKSPGQALALDISIGKYRPDLIIGQTGGADISYCLRAGLYTDLSSYLDSDPVVNRDNVFGAVLRAFDDGVGKIWGLADNFSISTLAAPDSVLPERYRNGWTLDDLLDFADTLPHDVTLIEGLTRETAARKLLGTNGYAAFIDWENMTCSFDSPTFLRWLNFMKSLPKDDAELSRRSVFDRETKAEKYAYYYDGKVALSVKTLKKVYAALDAEFQFDTSAYSLPGYPGAGSTLSTDFAFLVTSFSDATDDAWAFMRSVITSPDTEAHRWRMFGLSSLKSSFDDAARDMTENYVARYTFEGSFGIRSKSSEDAYTMDRPGTAYDITKEDTDRIRDYFDNIAGSPIKADLPDEVAAILDEEISALIADAATPESCAKNIQSRVSIWLAEHQ